MGLSPKRQLPTDRSREPAGAWASHAEKLQSRQRMNGCSIMCTQRLTTAQAPRMDGQARSHLLGCWWLIEGSAAFRCLRCGRCCCSSFCRTRNIVKTVAAAPASIHMLPLKPGLLSSPSLLPFPPLLPLPPLPLPLLPLPSSPSPPPTAGSRLSAADVRHGRRCSAREGPPARNGSTNSALVGFGRGTAVLPQPMCALKSVGGVEQPAFAPSMRKLPRKANMWAVLSLKYARGFFQVERGRQLTRCMRRGSR